MSPVLIREKEHEPYRLATYLQTAKKSPWRAAKEIAGAVLLGIILFAFCLFLGTQ